MMVRTLFLLASLLLAAVWLVACGDDFGQACDLPTRVLAACSENQGGGGLTSKINCVMKENLDCSSKLCAVYQNSEPFCSEACTTDGDCPSGASCRPFLLEPNTDQYCVPSSKLEN